MNTFHLSVWDYIIFGIVLAISAAIGIYFRFTGGKQQTIQEYLLADGQMSATPVAFSLMASFISAITILGVSSEVYNYGTQFLLINFAYVIGTPIVCYVYLPVFYRLRVYSVYQYLQLRFGKTTRLIASTAFLIQMILYMGIVLYAPSLALSAVTGLDKTAAILSVGTVCTFYSTVGGMKAVLFTDVFQSFLMLAAIICVIGQGILEFDGVGKIWSTAMEGHRLEFFKLSIDPTERYTFFTQLIGGTFVFLSLYGVNQAQVQRLLSTKSLRTARLSLWYSLPLLFLISFSTGFAGLVIYTKYKDCDPILDGRIRSSDQLLPLFVVDSFNHIPGVTGLFIAGILSGSLSTVSSAINSLAAVTFEDYCRPLLNSQNLQASTVSLITKVLALVYGVICVALAFIAENFAGVLQASLTIFGIVGGPLLGLFTCGMLFPATSEITVIPAFITGLLFTSWIGFGQPKPRPVKLPIGDMCGESNTTEIFSGNFSSSSQIASESVILSNFTSLEVSPVQDEDYFYLYRISYQWYPMIGFAITVFLAMILSMFYRKKGSVDPNLLSPPLVEAVVKE